MEIEFICNILFIELYTMRSLKVDAETVRHDVAEPAPTHKRLSLGCMENLEVFMWRLPVRLTAADHAFLVFLSNLVVSANIAKTSVKHVANLIS